MLRLGAALPLLSLVNLLSFPLNSSPSFPLSGRDRCLNLQNLGHVRWGGPANPQAASPRPRPDLSQASVRPPAGDAPGTAVIYYCVSKGEGLVKEECSQKDTSSLHEKYVTSEFIFSLDTWLAWRENWCCKLMLLYVLFFWKKIIIGIGVC